MLWETPIRVARGVQGVANESGLRAQPYDAHAVRRHSRGWPTSFISFPQGRAACHEAGTFDLSNVATNTVSTGSLLFKIQDAGSNRIYGDASHATALLDGLFGLDLDALTAGSGAWNLVDTTTLNETLGGNFGVVDHARASTFT